MDRRYPFTNILDDSGQNFDSTKIQSRKTLPVKYFEDYNPGVDVVTSYFKEHGYKVLECTRQYFPSVYTISYSLLPIKGFFPDLEAAWINPLNVVVDEVGYDPSGSHTPYRSLSIEGYLVSLDIEKKEVPIIIVEKDALIYMYDNLKRDPDDGYPSCLEPNFDNLSEDAKYVFIRWARGTQKVSRSMISGYRSWTYLVEEPHEWLDKYSTQLVRSKGANLGKVPGFTSVTSLLEEDRMRKEAKTVKQILRIGK